MFKHILVPTDGSDLSKKAIDGAIDLAQAVGARVTAYACLPQYPYSPFSEVVIEPPVDFQDRRVSNARARRACIRRRIWASSKRPSRAAVT
jgi:nucleotide-binding universal stress UspA family protein